MAKYEFEGTVTEILPTRTYGQRGIQSREFRCKEDPVGNSKWENKLPFVINYDPSGDKYNNLSQLDHIGVGDRIKFSFTMRGREWKNPKDNVTRLFVDNKVCSKITVLKAANGKHGNSHILDAAIPPPTFIDSNDDSGDDEMPF